MREIMYFILGVCVAILFIGVDIEADGKADWFGGVLVFEGVE
jgi:hypothetical protein